MKRHVDEDGLDYQGYEVAWRDIAVFDSSLEAEGVLRKLRAQ